MDTEPQGWGSPSGRRQRSISQTVVAGLRPLVAVAAKTPTGRLPSERALATHFGVSRGTIRAALACLADQGEVVATRNSGWYAAATPLSPPSRTLVSFTQLARRRGQVVSTTVLHRLVRMASCEERDALCLKAPGQVLEMSRLRCIDNRPVCVDRTVATLGLLPGLAEADFSNRSLYDVIGQCGEMPTRSDITLEAVPAGMWAKLLSLEVSEPVIVADEVTYGQFGAPILLGRAVYRADSYRFHATLTARSGSLA